MNRRTPGGTARPARTRGHGAGRRTRGRRADVGRTGRHPRRGHERTPTRGLARRRRRGRQRHGRVGRAGGTQRRRPRAGVDPPARWSVVAAPGHLGQRRHHRRDRPRHQRRRLHRRRLDPERRHARRARGRDPGAGWRLVGARPRRRQRPSTAEAPQVVVDAAGNAVAHMDRRQGPCLAATKPAGGTWSAADEVSDPAVGLGVDTYDLVGTPGGLATVAWEHDLTMRRPGHPGRRPSCRWSLRRSRDHLVGHHERLITPMVAVNAAGWPR